AGVYDVKGEAESETAARELREETGYRATTIRPLVRLLSSPGFTDERIDVFVANVEPEGDPEEGIEVVVVPLPEAVGMVERGEIEDAKTVAALLLASRVVHD
ncbi:MAG TPA: NUDIX hydrolase, partial [Actinomycetota bacterium]|nr:NUDIX hydrolase [Actinomycetota bacterium]